MLVLINAYQLCNKTSLVTIALGVSVSLSACLMTNTLELNTSDSDISSDNNVENNVIWNTAVEE